MTETEVVIAHDYSTQRGGAERVALVLTRMYPGTRFMTALYDPAASYPGYSAVDVRPSLLNRVRTFRRNPQLALPVLHYAWTLRRPVSAAAVLVSSSGWAHAVRVSQETVKVVYCHNPPRWIYQTDEYLIERSLWVRLALGALRPVLFRWDQRAAKSVDRYIANSASVAARIKTAYGIDAQIIHPPVTIDPSAWQTRPGGVPDGFFLTVGRQRGYKGTANLIAAFEEMPHENLVVVGGRREDSSRNVFVINDVAEAELRWLYDRATALLSVSKEDFGLTPIEANSFGTPALLVKAGGFLDSLDEGTSGLFIEDTSIRGIVNSVETFPRHWDSAKIRAHAARFSFEEFERKLKQVVTDTVENLADPEHIGEDTAYAKRNIVD